MMTRFLTLLLITICSLSLSACTQVSLFSWSPDGSTMSFAAHDGLRLAEANGKLSQPLLKNVVNAIWLKDSHHLLVLTVKELKEWQQIERYLTDDQQKCVEESARYLKQKVLLDKWISPEPILAESTIKPINETEELPVPALWHSLSQTDLPFIYLKDDKELLLKKKENPSLKPPLDNGTCNLCQLSLVEISNNQIVTKKELWSGLSEVKDLRVSPNKEMAMIVANDDWSDQKNMIVLISLDFPREPKIIAHSICDHAAWSADSKHLYIAQRGALTGYIGKLEVWDEQGQPSKISDIVTPLIYSTVNEDMDIASAGENKILFTASPAELPATAFDLYRTKNLFSFIEGQQVVNRLLSLSEADELKNVSRITVSPGAQWITVSSSTEENFEIINLKTGMHKRMSASSNYLPSWRNADEICFLTKTQYANKSVPRPTSKSADALNLAIMNLSTDEVRVISYNWPRSATLGILIPENNK